VVGIRVIPESAAPDALDGERKTVTALFADIKGSPIIRPRRLPGDWRPHPAAGKHQSQL
jgi:class 3 adenylate cyclase